MQVLGDAKEQKEKPRVREVLAVTQRSLVYIS